MSNALPIEPWKPHDKTAPSRREFLERLTKIFGAVALAPGLTVLEQTPVGFENFARIGATFEVLKDGGWFVLGNLTHVAPPELLGMNREPDGFIRRLEQAPLRFMVNDVPVLISILGRVWFDKVTHEHSAPKDTTLYRVVFSDGQAFFFPAKAEPS